MIRENDKPKMLHPALTEEDLIDYLLEQSPEFIAELHESQKEFEANGGISLEDYLKSEGYINKKGSKPKGLT